MTRYKHLLPVILLLAMAAQLTAGCSQASPQQIAPPAATSSEPGKTQTNLDVVSAKAIVMPHKKALLSFKTPGRVQKVLVSEGQMVKAGQELARLGTQAFDQAVLQAQANLKSTQSQLEKARAGARPEEIAEAEAAVAIAQAGVQARDAAVSVGKGNLEAARADLQAAQTGIDVARSGLAAAEAKLNGAQANLNKLLAGPTATEISIAAKEVERAKNDASAMEKQRDASWSTLEGRLEALRATVQIAQLKLEQLKAGARAEDIAAARAQVAQAAAGVQTARAQLAQAESRVSESQAAVQTTEARLAQTTAQLASARTQVAQMQARLDLAKAGSRAEDIAIAEAAVAQAAAALAEATDNREDAILRAPFDGTVGEILLREGETALPQVPAINLGDLTRLRVETEDLSEVDVDRVRVGQQAQITVDALDGKAFKGIVSRVAPVASDRRGDKVYIVTLDLQPASGDGLRWGMSSFVEIKAR
jgi:HlyD family secretion protein